MNYSPFTRVTYAKTKLVPSRNWLFGSSTYQKQDTVYLFVFDGYANWEPTYATIGLTKFSLYRVKTFIVDEHPICSMGGLSLQPDLTIEEVDLSRINLLILPGGYNVCEKGNNQQVVTLVKQLIQQQTQVAVICGATTISRGH
ncbi:DJ-1/PfpI family protein [Spirosoma validum]|uniref:DJ-1/PfpI family protein n=1 Tax=Spirosoma validum TaxID=2771355 RepID=A0A927GEZ3_9BACT|nr:DJ-1/PfpI family protein [Spirosoma validum]MBD2755156.1 DJ-1/PfpI family protein [Spirosoma validum]